MLKRIALSISLMAFAGVLIYGATGAFFSDSETSTGNTFTAGDIDLKIDNESYVTNNAGVLVASPANSWAISDLTNQLFFSFGDVKPGDVGEDTISVHAGSNDAYACMAAAITGTPENTLVDPEVDAGDAGPAAGNNGELQNYLNFAFWNDDGDNVYETGESQITQWVGPASSIFNGLWVPVTGTTTTAIPGNSTKYVGKAWCFGTLTIGSTTQDGLGKTGSNGPLVRGTGFTCNGAGSNNIAQTDGIVVDVSFQAVQARNNGQFTCSSLPAFAPTSTTPTTTVVVNQNSLNVAGWFFYNDTNPEGVMTIDQFATSSGQNHMDSVAGEAGAKMVLHTSAGGLNPRYNIATAQFGGTLLNAISALNFRVYDATVDSDTPYLNFNVDFATTTVAAGYEGRLTMQPGSSTNAPLAASTWTTVDAINSGNAMWTWSKFAVGPNLVVGGGDDNTWPDGNTNQYRSWNSILAAFPTAKLLTPGTFLGVRTGQPGPAGATNFVSSIKFNATTYNFEL